MQVSKQQSRLSELVLLSSHNSLNPHVPKATRTLSPTQARHQALLPRQTLQHWLSGRIWSFSEQFKGGHASVIFTKTPPWKSNNRETKLFIMFNSPQWYPATIINSTPKNPTIMTKSQIKLMSLQEGKIHVPFYAKRASISTNGFWESGLCHRRSLKVVCWEIVAIDYWARRGAVGEPSFVAFADFCGANTLTWQILNYQPDITEHTGGRNVQWAQSFYEPFQLSTTSQALWTQR